MNSEQKKWFKKLEKHLLEIPQGIELAVTSAGDGNADILLLEEGKADALEDAQDDRCLIDFGAESLSRFVAKNIAVSSENF